LAMTTITLYPRPQLTSVEMMAPKEEQLKLVFKNFDKNRDRKLCREELKEAFKYLGAYIPEWRAWWSLHHADANDDGFIDEDEMNKLVKYAVKFGYTVK
ncbi:unnamed protein product, partial [Ilex paraguariensis]